LVPGARLPTYLAAGFLRLPAAKFLWVTGVASFIWTVIVLLLVRSVGAPLLDWLGDFKRGGWAILALLVSVCGALHLLRTAGRSWISDGCPRGSVAGGIGSSGPLGCSIRRWPSTVVAGDKVSRLTLPTAANPGIFSAAWSASRRWQHFVN